MKLSEAIRKGAQMRPKQAFGQYIDFDNNASCAVGAAMDGLNGSPVDNYTFTPHFYKSFPELIGQFLESDILTWNDNERLTREEIADRLAARGL